MLLRHPSTIVTNNQFFFRRHISFFGSITLSQQEGIIKCMQEIGKKGIISIHTTSHIFSRTKSTKELTVFYWQYYNYIVVHTLKLAVRMDKVYL